LISAFFGGFLFLRGLSLGLLSLLSFGLSLKFVSVFLVLAGSSGGIGINFSSNLVLSLNGSSYDLLLLINVVVNTIFSFPMAVIGKQIEIFLPNVRGKVATQGSGKDSND